MKKEYNQSKAPAAKQQIPWLEKREAVAVRVLEDKLNEEENNITDKGKGKEKEENITKDKGKGKA